jgi:ABC-type lipoprotein release transport system permease subunit
MKELLHRKTHFLLSALAVTVAAGMFVAFMMTAEASNRETAKLMLKAGFNLRIIPKAANLNDFLNKGYSEATMPAEYLDRIASQKGFSYNHLLATLQKKISWRSLEVRLTGLAPEANPPDRKTPPMVFAIKEGTAYVGCLLARQLAIKQGDEIEINGTKLKVVKCLAESGDIDDIRIQCHLADAQKILNLPGRINEIQAVDCLCFTPTDNPVAILRQELAQLFDDVQVIQMKNIAEARTEQRRMVKSYLGFIMISVVAVCGAWICVLAMLNVRQRESEIGIMRAIGFGSVRVVALLLGRAVVTGLLGAIVGFAAGSLIALHFGPGIFSITARAITTDYRLLLWSLAAAPAFAAVSSFIPAMIAISRDPADTLREE